MSHGKRKKQNLFLDEALGWREDGSYLSVFSMPLRSHTGCFEVWEDMLEKGGIRFDFSLFWGINTGENGEMFSESLL